MWNPAALSYLAELTLVLALTFCFLRQLQDERRAWRMQGATLFLTLTMLGLTGAILFSLLRSQLGGFYDTYAMPWEPLTSPRVLAPAWVPVAGSGAVVAFVQFAYRFPRDLPGAERERRIVGVVSLALLLAEAGAALATDWSILHRAAWYKPQIANLWIGAAVCWGGWVFLRQVFVAQQEAGGKADLGGLFRRGLPRPAAAARAYLLLLVLPLIQVAMLAAGQSRLFDLLPLDVISCWMVLALLTGFSLIYFSYQADQSSFMLKMVVISLALVLGVLAGFDWLIDPAFIEDFHPPAAVTTGTTLRFVPDGKGGYAAGLAPFAPDTLGGAPITAPDGRLDLPFAFPFYGADRRTLFVSPNGAVGFTRTPDWLDLAMGYGSQPAIYPLAIRMIPQSGTGVTAARGSDRVVLRWKAECGRGARRGRCQLQLVLHRDGVIDMNYLETPDAPAVELFEPRAAPWFFGVTSGVDPAPRPIVLAGGRVAQGAPGQALIQDEYLAFLQRLNHVYAPLAWLMLAAAAAVSIALPTYFRLNLIRPMGALLEGMKTFQAGDFGVRVPITHNDEIGYLTGAFNEMAGALQSLVTDLENQVAERVGEVSRFAAKTALLEERSRLAAELHDTVSQNLFSASLIADSLSAQLHAGTDDEREAVEQIRSLNRHALEEVRTLMTDLHAEKLAGSPLSALLRELVDQFAAANRLPVDANIEGKAMLPTLVQAMFYRVAQETLSNVARHARASRVQVRLATDHGRAELTISDNGRGFDASEIPPGHLGLQIMSYRAGLVGAQLTVASRPGVGTTLTLNWPVEARSAPSL